MKRRIISILLLLTLLIFAIPASAEGILAFEDAAYSVDIGKTIKPKVQTQGIDGKLQYEYSSGNEAIATVKNGTVKGVAKGTTEIVCKATAKDGTLYTATCSVEVKVPIKSIKVEDKSITLAPRPDSMWGKVAEEDVCWQYKPAVTISPEDATNQELEWSTADWSVARVEKDGIIIGETAGTTTVTGKATDGSGKSVKIKVTVPMCYVSESNVTITEPEGVIVDYIYASVSGINMYSSKETGNCFYVDYLGENEATGLNQIRIVPTKAGTGKFTFTRNRKTIATINVKVEHSAVYDTVSYPPMSAEQIMKNNLFNQNVQLSCVIAQVGENNQITAYTETKSERVYLSFEGQDASHLDVGATYTVYGQVKELSAYQSETGLNYDCLQMEVRKIKK